MKFSVVALLFAAAVQADEWANTYTSTYADNAAVTYTTTDLSSTLVTVTSCGPEVTNCPYEVKPNTEAPVYSSSSYVNYTNVSTYEAAGNKQFAFGAAALAAGALLAL